jgi:4,4'-diapolycopenoate synthase
MMKPTAEHMLACAREAQPAWAALSVSRRCALLRQLRREIARQCESIAETVAHETSKPLLDALSGDVLVTLEHIRFCEARAERVLQTQRPGKPAFFYRGADFETHFEPHGVVLVFSPSNYPFQLAVIPLVTALAAGNAVVLKCSERTPQTATCIEELCAKAGLPDGLVRVICDAPDKSAELIDAHPDLIFFTGSSMNGQRVAERAAKHVIPVILELGGKDASLVFADCHLERTVEGITYGAFSNTGRVCIAVKRAYVEGSIYDKFLARLKERVAVMQIGSDYESDFIPLAQDQRTGLGAQVADAIALGANRQYPKDWLEAGGVPVVLTDVPPQARILNEESFGPVLCVAPFHSEAEAVALANASSFALSSSIWTGNRARGRRVALQLSAGSCAVNSVISVIANPYAPFGGNKLSGYGRYHGPEGLRAFSRTKTVMFSGDRKVRDINWFPFKSSTRRQLAGLLRFRHGATGLAGLVSRAMLLLLMGALSSFGVAAQARAESRLSIEVGSRRRHTARSPTSSSIRPKAFRSIPRRLCDTALCRYRREHTSC